MTTFRNTGSGLASVAAMAVCLAAFMPPPPAQAGILASDACQEAIYVPYAAYVRMNGLDPAALTPEGILAGAVTLQQLTSVVSVLKNAAYGAAACSTNDSAAVAAEADKLLADALRLKTVAKRTNGAPEMTAGQDAPKL